MRASDLFKVILNRGGRLEQKWEVSYKSTRTEFGTKTAASQRFITADF